MVTLAGTLLDAGQGVLDPRRTRVRIESNASTLGAFDAAGHLHLGGEDAAVSADGSFAFTDLVSTADIDGLAYQVHVDYPTVLGKGRGTWASGWFGLTADSTLSEVASIATPQAVPITSLEASIDTAASNVRADTLTAATNAQDAATAAATSETNAASSATAAATSETNAATSATDAADSAAAAAASAAPATSLIRSTVSGDISTDGTDIATQLDARTAQQVGYVKAAKAGLVGLGDSALSNFGTTTTPDGVVGIGARAMQNLTDAVTSIAIGRNAMRDSTMTRDNIAIGESALQNVKSRTTAYDQSQRQGTRNIAIGGNAGLFSVEAQQTVFVGRNAGQGFVAGTGPVAIGSAALAGSAPTGLSGQIENQAPWGVDGTTYLTTAVGYNTAPGCQVTDITAIGGNALSGQKKGAANTAVGAKALAAMESTCGPHGGDMTTLNITGTYTQTGTSLVITAPAHGATAGQWVTFQLLDGDSATLQGDTPTAVVADVTTDTITITSPISRSASGSAKVISREATTTAIQRDNNTAVGVQALTSATSASSSTAVGVFALNSATTASASVAVGYNAAAKIATANSVTAIGHNALRFAQDGSDLTNGAWNNITGIGWSSRVSGANQLQLGYVGTTTYAYGAVQDRSDERDKTEIRDTALGLDFIKAVRPVDFKWDMRDAYTDFDPVTGEATVVEKDGSRKGARYHHGVIAQEIAGLIETGMIEDFGGFQDHARNGGLDVLSIGYTEFIGPLIKAVQELAAEVEELKETHV